VVHVHIHLPSMLLAYRLKHFAAPLIKPVYNLSEFRALVKLLLMLVWRPVLSLAGHGARMRDIHRLWV
jgi:hypothetical protein